MPDGKKSKFDKEERKLQLYFGLGIAFVVLGLLTFVILVIKDLQH